MFKHSIFVFIFIFFWVSPSTQAQDLCSVQETVVFSFQGMNSKKWMSLCKESDSKYLVYRFGTKKNIELQYPAELDGNSWKKFDFAGRRRGGGKANAGFGDYSLSFTNGKAEYVVFQEWSDEDDTYSIGINIQGDKKSITLLGNPKTQKGSLILLESENKNISNTLAE
ncbi:MAG TPA: hypothetical protein VJ654_16355 [Noviherbaspirillum sp.]|nr:hypothetical protein [Noviherbaspirillum sp.]